MLIRSRAIVLSTLHYADDKLICRLLTEEEGCVSFMVRRSQSRHSKHKLFTPLSMLSVEWNKTARSNLPHPKSVNLLAAYTTIPYDAQKMSVALFLSEFLNAALRAEPPAKPLFTYVEQSLLLYDRLPGGHANFHLVFLVQLATFLGLQPDTSYYHQGSVFDLREGTFSSIRPSHSEFIPPAEASFLPLLMRMNFNNMNRFRMSGSERTRLLGYLIQYYRLHIPAFPELNSLDVLHEVWH